MSLRAYVDQAVPINDAVRMLWPERWRSFNRPYSIRCPLHRDTTPSLRINTLRNRAVCYGACQTSWSPVGLVIMTRHCSEAQAISELETYLDLDTAVLRRALAIMAPVPDQTDPVEVWEQVNLTSRVAYEYLRGRALPDELLKGLEYGLLGARLALPHRAYGILTAITTRALGRSEPKYSLITGPLGPTPYGLDTIDRGEPLWLVEGPIDALSLRSLGLPAAAVGTHPDSDALAGLSGAPVWMIMMDGDEAGQRAAQAIFAGAWTTRSHIVPLPEGKDPNDLLQDGTLRQVARKALAQTDIGY